MPCGESRTGTYERELLPPAVSWLRFKLKHTIYAAHLGEFFQSACIPQSRRPSRGVGSARTFRQRDRGFTASYAPLSRGFTSISPDWSGKILILPSAVK